MNVDFDSREASESRRTVPVPGLAPLEPASKDSQASRIEDLEGELAITRRNFQLVIEDQQAITEELQAANEQIQSSNEELQSALEMLLTAKEELLSSNETLSAGNDELRGRIDKLTRANNELIDFLNSARIPMVVLSCDLQIRQFTSQAERILKLLPGDTGRPIGDLKLKIDLPDLERIVRGVLEDLSPVEREVRDRDDRIWSMSIRPYRTHANQIAGVVLTFFDLPERCQAADARFRRFFESSRDGILICETASGIIVEANSSACTLLGRQQSDLLGRSLFDESSFQRISAVAHSFAGLAENVAVSRQIRFLKSDRTCADLEAVACAYREGGRRFVQLSLWENVLRQPVEARLAGVEVFGAVGKVNPSPVK